MKLIAKILIITLGFIIGLNECNGLTCKTEGIFGITSYMECPGANDNPENRFCCGDDENRYCCNTPFGVSDEELKILSENLPAIIGTILAIAICLLVLCVVCCCCCPFCLLHKRRTRGAVHNPFVAPPAGPTYFYSNVQAAQMQPVMMPQGYAPVQGAPPVQQPYPTQGYVPPPQGYAPQPGYGAPIPTPAPYPVSTSPQLFSSANDNPPPYVEKQMPYNPAHPN